MLTKKKKKMLWVIPFCILVLVTLACGSSTTEKLQDSVSTDEPGEEIISEPTEDESMETQTDSESESTEVEPTKTEMAEEVKKLELINYGFGQDENYGSYAFLLNNPNQSYSINNSQFQIAVYDESGTVLDTDSGYIEIILPDQTVGIGSEIYLDEGQVISNIEIQIRDGDPESSDQISTFITENINYYKGEYYSYVTGLINNPYNNNLTDLRVSAVLYDPVGNIIGGGFTYLNFILANSSTGISISLEDYGEVDKAEIYPIISGLTSFSSDTDIPDDSLPLNLSKFGFGQDEYSTGYGLLIENPNNSFALENSQYYIIGYSSDGSVLCTDGNYISTILPNETIGIAGDLYPHSDEDLDRIDVQIFNGKFVESESLQFFTFENAIYVDNAYFPEVTGTIINPYSAEITDLRVSAILYNEIGDIIGGGYTYLDFIPANGKAAIEVSVTSAGTPATVELFAAISSLSEINE